MDKNKFNNCLDEEDSKFNKHHDANFKLKHSVIDSCLYFGNIPDVTGETYKYRKAKMELFGNCILLVYWDEKGRTISYEANLINTEPYIAMYEYKTYFFSGVAEPYALHGIEDGLMIMEFNNDCKIKVDADSYVVIRNHFHALNVELNAKIKEFASDNIEYTLSIYNDINGMRDYISNFISQFPLELYTNVSLMHQIDAFLYFQLDPYDFNGIVMGSMLFSNEYIRFIDARMEGHFNEYPSPKVKLKNQELIESYYSNGLTYLVSFINEVIEKEDYFISKLDYQISHIQVYVLIAHVCKLKFSNEWEREYGNYFININSISLKYAVEVYFTIETIEHSSINTAGKFIYYLMNNKKFQRDNNNYFTCFDEFMECYSVIEKEIKMNLFKKRLSSKPETQNDISINDVDLMNGQEFENFVAVLFTKMGYQTEVTKASGDQGVDVIAKRNNTTIGIQAKCYSGTVGNSAVQEVVAGLLHYKCDKGIVVTNNYFTSSAKELAESNGIVLWDRDILKQKILEIY